MASLYILLKHEKFLLQIYMELTDCNLMGLKMLGEFLGNLLGGNNLTFISQQYNRIEQCCAANILASCQPALNNVSIIVETDQSESGVQCC